MVPKDAVEADERVDRAAERRGRGYSTGGVLLVAVLAVAVIAGLFGVTGPGMFSLGASIFVLGVAVAAITVATTAVLFSMGRTLTLLRGYQATIDDLQDERARAVDQEQVRTDRGQDEELAHLRSTFEDRIAQMEAEIARLQERATTVDREGLPGPTPFGDIHPVIDIEGIGETFEAQLADLNIVDTEQLWQADPETLARELDVPPKTVRSWQAMAELIALEHVGPQYAELLVRGDVMSIRQLADMEPKAVATAVQEAEEDRQVRIQGNPISEKHTEKWVQAARQHNPQAMRVRR